MRPYGKDRGRGLEDEFGPADPGLYGDETGTPDENAPGTGTMGEPGGCWLFAFA